MTHTKDVCGGEKNRENDFVTKRGPRHSDVQDG
jgi:hypothetical protein